MLPKEGRGGGVTGDEEVHVRLVRYKTDRRNTAIGCNRMRWMGGFRTDRTESVLQEEQGANRII